MSTADPLGAWAPAPHLEVSLLVARGYRVVLPNIRGSATYGGAWVRPQLGDWGGVDAADVHAALDHVVELGLADPDRLGVLGLSYGGFMVNWLVGTIGPLQGSRLGERRHQPGLRLGQLGHRARVQPERTPRRPAVARGRREIVAPVTPSPYRRHPDTPAAPPGRGRPPLPAPRQRAAVHRAPEPGPDRGVRPLPGRVPRLLVVGPAGSADRSPDADARLVRPVPARPDRALTTGSAPGVAS